MTKPDPIRIDIVSDVVCPWCVIGYHQLAKASRDTGIEIDVHLHPFELNPTMAEEGENLRDHLAAKYGTTLEGSIKARARLTEMGAALGFTFNYADDMRMVNTFRAHQLITWAADHGKAHEAKLVLFRAFFTRRENLNDPKVLVAAAGEIGLDEAAAREMLDEGRYARQVRQEEQFWTSRGVTGVPAMIFDQQHLVTGAQGDENYARILQHVAAKQAVQAHS
ncbi:MAG: DsbA family oxidoreductase [Pseudomonadota bacterium]